MTDTSPEMKQMFGGAPSGGFFDLPLVPAGETREADIILLGAPAATPYKSVGSYCATAPEAIRAAFGWPGVLGHHDFDIDGFLLPPGTSALDWGNLDYSETDFASNRESIRTHVEAILGAGAVPLVLGGDDSIPIPVLQAYRDHGPLTILQFDAHIDWRDEVAGETRGLSSNMRRASEMGWVENIIQVGARGIGSARPAGSPGRARLGRTILSDARRRASRYRANHRRHFGECQSLYRFRYRCHGPGRSAGSHRPGARRARLLASG